MSLSTALRTSPAISFALPGMSSAAAWAFETLSISVPVRRSMDCRAEWTALPTELPPRPLFQGSSVSGSGLFMLESVVAATEIGLTALAYELGTFSYPLFPLFQGICRDFLVLSQLDRCVIPWLYGNPAPISTWPRPVLP